MTIEEFSAGYWFVPDVAVSIYNGEHAIIQDDVFWDIRLTTGLNPVIGSAGGSHFELYPERSIPSDVVAIPRDIADEALDGATLLVSKRNGHGVFGVG